MPKTVRQKPTISIAGDRTIDWFFLKRGEESVAVNARPGGALLLQAFLTHADDVDIAPDARALAAALKESRPTVGHRAFFEAKEFQQSDRWSDQKSKSKTFRADKCIGFVKDDHAREVKGDFMKSQTGSAGFVLLFDGGLSFRGDRNEWPAGLTGDASPPLIILRTKHPFEANPLLKHLALQHADRLITVVDAGSLRKADISIPRGLSWESTVSNFIGQMESSKKIPHLMNSRHVLVRFGLDAVLHCDRDSKHCRLFYHPDSIEGEIEEKYTGHFVGYGAAFCASLVLTLATAASSSTNPADGLDDAIREAMGPPRYLLFRGYDADMNCDYGMALRPLLKESAKICVGAVPHSPLPSADDRTWSFLSDAMGRDHEKMLVRAKNIVNGDPALEFPVANYGALKSTDRLEIESFRTIKNAIAAFLGKKAPKRPLSLAAFGDPGTGKSFGITEIARHFSGQSIEPVTFNVSQFIEPGDLIACFRKIQDIALKGTVPLAFFDEFDAKKGTEELGWLKYFLAPMQDGVFDDGQVLGRPIGRTILVFAGGTYRRFRDFDAADDDSRKDAKAKDFISRLRGHIDIMGVNSGVCGGGYGFMLKRAILIRSILERHYSQLLEMEHRTARIDADILTWMLSKAQYKHGARSIEAIFDMSSLPDANRAFNRSNLPSNDQQEMHVLQAFAAS